MNKKRVGLIGSIAAAALAAVACGGTNHDTLNPQNDLVPGKAWVRVETPPGITTLYVTCVGKTLFVVDPDGNSQQTDNASLCGGTGVNWYWEKRVGSKPAQIVGIGSGTLYGNPASDVQANTRP